MKDLHKNKNTFGSKTFELIKESLRPKVVKGNAAKWLCGLLIIPAAMLITSSGNQEDRKYTPDPDPEKELASFNVADGFEISLFAAEPMVVKPIQMNWDADGRLWVVSSESYPHVKTGEEANDKIYVLEDTDGDGKADKSTIFADGLLTPTGILPGDGGVYVANSTEILFLQDTDGDGKADKRSRVLTGFGTADTHHLIHTFRWGPDGDFYFNQSIYIYSHVETPTGVKRLEGGGVWQLKPKTLDLSVYAKGLVNPWGLQFNRWGASFLTDGAGGEGINYGFPGATYVTAPGAERIIRGLNPGQPKHSGLEMISGRHLPESWEGSVITNDFRANRINRFMLEEQGSGYVSKQMEDLLWTKNVAFRPVDISLGPDGAIYIADWYNPIIQHGEVDFHDPRRDHTNGRIWKITAKNRPLVKTPKLEKADLNTLLESLKAPEDWTRLQAKQVLKNRGSKDVIPALEKWIASLDKNSKDYDHNLLEALWVYQSLNTVNEKLLLSLLNSNNHNARAAAVRVLNAWSDKVSNVPSLLSKAVADPHARVRLEAVIALRKLNSPEAAKMALSVLDFQQDEFLDFALWQTMRELEPQWIARLKQEPNFLGDARKTIYALKSVNEEETVSRLVEFYKNGQVPEEYQKDVMNSIVKAGNSKALNVLFDIALTGKQNTALELSTLEDAARQRKIKPEQNLGRIAAFVTNENDGIAASALRLIGYWGLENQSSKVVELINKGDNSIKKAGLNALALMNTDASKRLISGMTESKNSPELRLLAISQLASFDPEMAAASGIRLLQNLPAGTDPSEFFQTFISNKKALGILGNVLKENKIPEDIAKTGRIIIQRQLPWYRQNEDDVKNLKAALEASGGVLPKVTMKQDLHPQEISDLASRIKSSADAAKGELVYRKAELSCMTCHALGGAGGLIGPDLSSLGTSSPVETIIKSVIDPTFSIKEGYELQRVVKKDGGEMMGYLVSDGISEIIIRDVTGHEVTIAKSQVDRIENIAGSLMPPGLTAGLDQKEFIDLIGFLSKLGETGDFRVPNVRFVRRWETVDSSPALISKIKSEGLGHLVKTNAKLQVSSAYSKVAGDLPLNELPIIEVAGNRKYSVLKFDIEVISAGNVNFVTNLPAGFSAWVGQKQIKANGNQITTELSQGMHNITLVIDRTVNKEGAISIQVPDGSGNAGLTRLVMGR